MEDKWHFPSAFSGVDGCHIPMKCPSRRNIARKENYNFKTFYSIVMMGIAGTDTHTFQASHLYQNIVSSDFLPEIQKVVNLINGNEFELPPICWEIQIFHIMRG